MPKSKNYYDGFLEARNEQKKEIVSTLIEDYSKLEELNKFPLLNRIKIIKLESSIDTKREILGLNKRPKIIKLICPYDTSKDKYIMKDRRWY